MTPQDLVKGLYQDCLNPRRLDRLTDYLADDFLGAGGEQGPAGFRTTVERMVTAFPDLKFEIEDLFGAGDRICVRWRFEAEHRGPLGAVAPSGRMATQQGIGIYEARDGKLARAWLQVDRLGVLQQIGAIKP
ncbi:ester cyclase [Oryzibacter oryziterrae]|uniref:ester cyclase n=1 Tax=Oryzibacter oryziterrae TaxID=2766474 RepID=UPI001F17067F|nr:ester cyclase [Oryzibacter oryziterrae]